MDAAVVGYSERGLVNALVTFLRGDVARVRTFLAEGLSWCDGGTAATVRALARDVAHAVFLVEPGFAQFGDPDLVVVAHGQDRRRLATFFVEAKVVPYAGAVRDNGIARPMGRRGYNSSINGQLQLRYRLARALAAWAAQGGAATSLEEPAGVFGAYAAALGDPLRPAPGHAGRRLAREVNLRHLVPLLADGDGLERMFFVALTDDDADPFARMARRAGSDPSDGVPRDPCAPWYLADVGASSGGNAAATPWALAARHTGWCGWRRLEQTAPALGTSPDYAAARPLSLVAAAGDGACLCEASLDGAAVRTVRWDALRDEVVASADRLGALLEAEARRVFGERADRLARAGSLTVTRDRETVAKVVPVRENGRHALLVGLAADLSTPTPPRFDGERRRINRRAFACARLPLVPDDAALAALRDDVGRYFDDLRRIDDGVA